MNSTQFIAKTITKKLPSGNFTWKAPSNIALIKYWGKYGLQFPKNTSVSFTLSQCLTETKLRFIPLKSSEDKIDFKIFLEGKPAPEFRKKIETYFDRIEKYVSFIKDYQFEIDTKNTFPHSSGIASSASGLAALSLCIMTLERTLNPAIDEDYFYQKASFLARLGSGSAARSIQGPIMIWGNHAELPNSANEYAISNSFELHPNFKQYQDCILLVDKGEKQVSSTLGHQLMKNHPYAESRFKQAQKNLLKMIDILKDGDLERFIKLTESEALTLHAMMMTSNPYFILMKPHTLEIINKVWKFRENTKNHACFTLDAGANVHLLFPKNEKRETLQFINTQLTPYCQSGQYISDEIGQGAEQL